MTDHKKSKSFGTNKKITITSLLTKEIRIDKGQINPALINKCVLFFDNLIAVDSITWTYTTNNSIQDDKVVVLLPWNGGYEVTLVIIPDSFSQSQWDNFSELEVRCEVVTGGSTIVLTLDFEVTAFYPDLTKESAKDERGNSLVKSGYRLATQHFGNTFRPYLTDSTYSWGADEVGFPMNYAASIAYNQLLVHTIDVKDSHIIGYLRQLNYLDNYDLLRAIIDDDVSADLDFGVGICKIPLHLLATMYNDISGFLQNSNIPGASKILSILRLAKNSDSEINNQNVKTEVDKLYNPLITGTSATNLLLDLYNLARFPKSCLKLSSILFKYLFLSSKANSWSECKLDAAAPASLSVDDLKNKSKLIKNIYTHYFDSPTNSVKSFNKAGIRAARHDWSPYIKKLLTVPVRDVESELIKIRAIDVRSGKPIKNAEVKELIIEHKKQTDTDPKYIIVRNRYGKSQLSDANTSNIYIQCKRAIHRMLHLSGNSATVTSYSNSTWTKSISDKFNEFLNQFELGTEETLSSKIKENTPSAKGHLFKFIYDLYKEGMRTDDNGYLKIRIPKTLTVDRDVNIHACFYLFPVANFDSNFTLNSATGYRIKRTGAQKSESGGLPYLQLSPSTVPTSNPDYYGNTATPPIHFGWEIIHGNKSTKLRYCDGFVVKTHDSAVEKKFNLMGLQWCQPVFDEFDDSELLNGNEKYAYAQDSSLRNLNMHLVTLVRDLNGDFNYGGKGYAKFENAFDNDPKWRGDDGHKGYDLHAKIDDFIYAFHGGKIVNSSGAHKHTKILWNKSPGTTNERTQIQYLHLKSFKSKTNDIVQAGMIVALGGRTGNIGQISQWPSHVHLNVGSINSASRKYYPSLRKTMDDYYPDNANVLPTNFSPMLFPCYSEVTSASTNPVACNLQNSQFAKGCWAAAELKCPHINKKMSKSSETNIQLQIQLRYLNEKPTTVTKKDVNVKYKVKSEESNSFPGYMVDTSAFLKKNNNTKYFYPGTIDGSIGSQIKKINNSIISAGTALTIKKNKEHFNADNNLKKVEYTDTSNTKRTTWIEADYIDSNNKLTVELKNLPSSKPGASRMAIYCFKKEHGLLSTSNYYKNFNTDASFWTALNQQCF